MEKHLVNTSLTPPPIQSDAVGQASRLSERASCPANPGAGSPDGRQDVCPTTLVVVSRCARFLIELGGARLCRLDQPQGVADAAAGLRHRRASLEVKRNVQPTYLFLSSTACSCFFAERISGFSLADKLFFSNKSFAISKSRPSSWSRYRWSRA